MQSTVHKVCVACTEVKPISSFRPNRRACKDCLNTEQRLRRAANPEKAKDQRRRSYYKHHEENLARMRQYGKDHRPRRREAARAYLEANRDRIRALDRERYAADRDRILARNKQWRTDNSELVRAISHSKRVRRQEAIAGVSFTQQQIRDRMASFGFRCWMCGGPFEHIDHVKPLALGGPHLLANLRPACAGCNLSNGARWFGVSNLHRFMTRWPS